MAAEKTMNVACANGDCVKMNIKYSKVQESRKVLRQALKLLEPKYNELQAMFINLQKAQGKIKGEEMLKKFNELTALRQKCEGNEDAEVLQARLSDNEKEIERLKELVEEEKIRLDSVTKIAKDAEEKGAETQRLLESQKKISAEKEMLVTKVAVEKDKEYRSQLVRLEKEIAETKMKLASTESKIQEATKMFEAEKQKLLAEKRIAESEAEKAQERIEVAKQEAAREKQRAEAELIKVEEQKKLAEDNREKAIKAERMADQFSQKLAENKHTIEDLKQKLHELSSLRKPNEISGVSLDVRVNAKVLKYSF